MDLLADSSYSILGESHCAKKKHAVDLLAAFDLFEKSPAFLNFSSPQLVRWSAYCMQKRACKKTQDFLVLHLESLSGIPRPNGQKKKRKTNEIPAPWNILDTVKLRGKGSLAQHGREPWTQPKTTQKPQTFGPIDKNHWRVVDLNTDLSHCPASLHCFLLAKTPTSIYITDFKKSPYPSQLLTPSALRKQNTTLLRTNTSHLWKRKIRRLPSSQEATFILGGYLHPSNVHTSWRALEKALWFDRCHKVCSPLPFQSPTTEKWQKWHGGLGLTAWNAWHISAGTWL